MRSHALLDDLKWRGLLYQHTDEVGDVLNSGPVSGYIGFDPTAPSLHIGSLLVIMLLVRLQRHGHRPVALAGGGTGLIGDPSGKGSERPLADANVVAQNTESIRRQLERFLDFSGSNAAKLVNNAEWLVDLRAVDFMRDVGKHFTVNYMLQKDSVQGRMEAGISYTEFSYMLLQAYDFLELRRRHDVRIQMGGSDQWEHHGRHRADSPCRRARRTRDHRAARHDRGRNQIREDRRRSDLARFHADDAVQVLSVLRERR